MASHLNDAEYGMRLSLFAGVLHKLISWVCCSLSTVKYCYMSSALLYCCNEEVGRFELSAIALSLFVGAFCALTLRARCLSLRSLIYLNVLALLHRCYMERLKDIGGIVAPLL